jgi:aminobenzoyl-glutamate transport protein
MIPKNIMSAANTAKVEADDGGFIKRMPDVVEKAGYRVPHPVMIFLFLIAVVVILSHSLHLTGSTVGI